jgi:phenylacetate-CoA ligase
LLSHAALHSPYYRDQPWTERIRSGADLHLSDIPVTPKSIVKSQTSAFHSDFVPSSEGPVIDKFTSGSTGEPIRLRKTARHFSVNAQENARLLSGWGTAEQTGYIRTTSQSAENPLGTVRRNGASGNNWTLYSRHPEAAIDLLLRTRCSHISLYPSQAVSMFELGAPLEFLRLLSTNGEVVPSELLELLAAYPRCLHYDVYGSIETGIIAAKCRQCGNYRIADRHLVVEILDENLRPVQPGQFGRVIVTPLYNLAMPLLRYDIGDVATLSKPAECEIADMAITKILGRDRNLFVLPNGSRVVPRLDAKDVFALNIRKYKLVQTAVDKVDFLYIPHQSEVVVEESRLRSLVAESISPLFQIRGVKVEALPKSASGKYLMHESLVETP